MKKILASAILILGIMGIAAAQTSLATAFSSAASNLAQGLLVDSTTQSNWDDAYVGSFPSFGVGITSGATFTGSGSVSALQSLGLTVPAALQNTGLPIPSAGGSFKIGIPFIPLDVGVSGMYIPPSVAGALLSPYGAGASFASLGLQVRYALVKQDLLLPNVSIGAAYYFQQGDLSVTYGQPMSYTVPSPSGSGSTNTITASAPKIDLNWKSNSFDFTAQVSKQILFIEPYLGVGATVGSTAVTGSISSNLTTDYAGGISGLASYLSQYGYSNLTSTGITYTTNVNDPIYRIYGGVALKIVLVDFDLQALYLPFNGQKLGATLSARIRI